MDILNFFNGVSNGVQNGVEAFADYMEAIYLSVTDTWEKINLIIDFGLAYIIVSAILIISLLVVCCQTKSAVAELTKEVRELKGAPDPAPVKRNSGDWPE